MEIIRLSHATFTRHPELLIIESVVGSPRLSKLPTIVIYKNCSLQAGKGILRSVNLSEQAIADMIPVDLPVNLIVAAAWYTAVYKPKQAMIYHSTTGALNPHTWGEMSKCVCCGCHIFCAIDTDIYYHHLFLSCR